MKKNLLIGAGVAVITTAAAMGIGVGLRSIILKGREEHDENE